MQRDVSWIERRDRDVCSGVAVVVTSRAVLIEQFSTKPIVLGMGEQWTQQQSRRCDPGETR